MSRVLREPLFHFVLLGAALFALNAWLGGDDGVEREDEVVVSAGRIESMAAIFGRTWQRPPSAQELKGLIDDFVLEEILYREGVALGLDRDDTIIRRRMRQKMEFVVDDLVALAEPTDEDLAGWLDGHRQDYARPSRVSFVQVFLDPKKRGDSADADAADLLAMLRADPDAWDPARVGDATLLSPAYGNAYLDVVERTFGGDFAERVGELTVGEWGGPIRSAFGLHLVRVDERVEGAVPPLEDVRAAVERDWRFAQREEAAARYRDELLEQYSVRIEWPNSDAVDWPLDAPGEDAE